jgi:hypothetical protein
MTDYDDVVSQLELTVDLRSLRKQREVTQVTDTVKLDKFNWTDPLNRLIWQKAFRERANSMILRDGKKYTIEYEPGMDRDGKKITRAWVKIGDGTIAPCGWFTVETVLRPEWVRST